MLCPDKRRLLGKIEGIHKREPHTQVWRPEEHTAKGTC